MYTDLLCEPEALQARLGDAVVFDCRFALADPGAGERAFEQDHIPGAQYLHLDRDLSGPRKQRGGRHPLPDVETFGARMRAAGVSKTTEVVAYDDSRFAFAARLWWLLRYLGHERVRVLNGGYAGFRAAGLSVTAATTTNPTGDFQPAPQPHRLVDRDAVRSLLTEGSAPAGALIDAREAQRYRGEVEPIDPVAGHIPGAVCMPWRGFTGPDGRAIPEADNGARWAGIAADDHPVVYCGSGVTACVNLLSMRAAGVTGARLYAGSWSDWCAHPDAPIATGH